MNLTKLIIYYIRWHYGKAFDELHIFWKNLLWFFYHFFSMPLLLKTMFRPIFRIHASSAPGTGLDLERIFENLAVNVIARIVGFFLRIGVIVVGGLIELVVLLTGPLIFLAWFILPVLPPLFILIGLNMIL